MGRAPHEISGSHRLTCPEGATIITHDSDKAFLEQSLAAPRTIQPDKLTQSGKKATIEGMQDKRVLSDATHIVELYRIHQPTERIASHDIPTPALSVTLMWIRVTRSRR